MDNFGILLLHVLNKSIKQFKNMITNNAANEWPVCVLDEKDSLVITAAPGSSENDFDFYVGDWIVKNKKLKTRLNNCSEWIEFETTVNMYKTLNGLGNIDHNYTTINGKPFEGMSLRFFNPQTKLWSIHWADTDTLSLDRPTVGSFDGDFGHFFTQDVLNGQEIIVVYRWDKQDKNQPVWSQAFSGNRGKTWEWNWYMYFTKRS